MQAGKKENSLLTIGHSSRPPDLELDPIDAFDLHLPPPIMTAKKFSSVGG